VHNSRHFDLSQMVLKHVVHELERQHLPVLRDTFPYHVITESHGQYVSLYCGGFDKRIDVMPLRKNGGCDRRYEEKSFQTPRGAVNYVTKLFKRKSW